MAQLSGVFRIKYAFNAFFDWLRLRSSEGFRGTWSADANQNLERIEVVSLCPVPNNSLQHLGMTLLTEAAQPFLVVEIYEKFDPLPQRVLVGVTPRKSVTGQFPEPCFVLTRSTDVGQAVQD